MVEIKLRSTTAELEKLTARKERAEKKRDKARAKAEKLGCVWTVEQHNEWLKTIETDNGWIVNKKDIEMNGAWFDFISAERELEEINRAIQKATSRLEKQQTEVENYRKELEKIEDLKRREELIKLDFEREQKEWAKDGIKLEARYCGKTPNGKRFVIERNNGWTERSLHCYSLWIGNMESGSTIFTSGEFWRAYAVIKNS